VLFFATMHASSCARHEATDALIVSLLIPSSGAEQRQAVRDTWMADMLATQRRTTVCDSPSDQPRPDRRVVCADARFFIGMTSRRDNFSALAAEFALHGDVVILPVAEGKQQLVAKTAAMFSWAGTHRAYASFVVKVDTDTYIHVPRLVQHLPSPSADLVLLGARHDHARRCPQGAIYGLSRALLRLITRGSGLITEATEASQRRVGMAKWAEDAFACMAIDRAVSRAGATLRRILLRPNASKGIWVHNIKDRGEYRRCHTVGDSCYGMDHPTNVLVGMARPERFDDRVCADAREAPSLSCPAGSIPGRNGAVACCPAACGACGGSGCDQRPGGRASCCGFAVAKSQTSCADSPPPCVPRRSRNSLQLYHRW
jgi:hypothetical protein